MKSILLFLSAFCLNLTAEIIYVDASNTRGSNRNGSSWPRAYTSLAAALNQTSSGDEIRIAEGLYTNPNALGSTAFFVEDRVTIIGGYPAGGGERGEASGPVILSGDSDGNDLAPVAAIPAVIVGHNSSRVLEVSQNGVVLEDLLLTAGNAADPDGSGAGLAIMGDQVVVRNCGFIGNFALGSGGGVRITGEEALLVNCTFTANLAGQLGGGVLVRGGKEDDTTQLINCEFKGNAAAAGAGIHSEGANLQLTNVTIAGNKASGPGGGIGLSDSATALLGNSIIWANISQGFTSTQASSIFATRDSQYASLSSTLENIVGDDPLFVSEPNPNSAPSGTGNLRLMPGSPVINEGREPNGEEFDRDGGPRLLGFATDQGAFEGGTVLYVDANHADGAQDGSSWENAFQYLQDALAVADRNTSIYLASHRTVDGNFGPFPHRPDQGSGQTPNDRDSTFNIPDGVRLVGGFPRGGGARNVAAYPTALSGHFGPNSMLSTGASVDFRRENYFYGIQQDAYNICTVNESAAFDGLIFSIADVRDSISPKRGSAIVSSLSTPSDLEVRHSEFWTMLSGGDGIGGAISMSGTLLMEDCHFENNFVSSNSDIKGGLCYIGGDGSEAIIRRCHFRDNKLDRQVLVDQQDEGTILAMHSPGGSFLIEDSFFQENNIQGFTNLIGLRDLASARIQRCEIRKNEIFEAIWAKDCEELTVQRSLFSESAPFQGPVNEGGFLVSHGGVLFLDGVQTTRVEHNTYAPEENGVGQISNFFRARYFIFYADNPQTGAPNPTLISSQNAHTNDHQIPAYVDATYTDNYRFGTSEDDVVLDRSVPAFDLRLSADSILIDAAVNSTDNETAALDGDGDGTATLDIGYYEFDPASPPALPTAEIIAISHNGMTGTTTLTVKTSAPYTWGVFAGTADDFGPGFFPGGFQGSVLRTPGPFGDFITWELPAGISTISVENGGPNRFFQMWLYGNY